MAALTDHNLTEVVTVTDPTPQKWAFASDDLSIYERVDPEEFPHYDDIDSRDVAEARMVIDTAGIRLYDAFGRLSTYGGPDGD